MVRTTSARILAAWATIPTDAPYGELVSNTAGEMWLVDAVRLTDPDPNARAGEDS